MIRTIRVALVIAAMGATVLIVAYVDRGSHSVSDTLYASVVPVLGVWMATGAGILALRRRERA